MRKCIKYLKWAEYFKRLYRFLLNIHKQLKKYGRISQNFLLLCFSELGLPYGKLHSEEKVEIVKHM